MKFYEKEEEEFLSLDADRREAILKAIPDRPEAALRMRYISEMTFKTIGEHLGVTANRAREITKEGLRFIHRRIAEHKERLEQEKQAKANIRQKERLIEIINNMEAATVNDHIGFGISEDEIVETSKFLKCLVDDWYFLPVHERVTRRVAWQRRKEWGKK